jgi:imidazolonepropionase-like amidohydrolase
MGRIAVRAAALFEGAALVAEPLVQVADGWVVEVSSRVSVPADAELVELPGATLLPGLVDTHVHLAFDAGPDPVGALAARDDEVLLAAMADAARAQLRAGVTTVRDLGDRLWQEGVLIVLAADAGIGPMKPHPTLPHAAEHLASLGVPVPDVLRTCTATAAQVCGLGERKGRIASGYDADLVAVPGDPLADLTVLQSPLAVFARGERVR